jgi:hypothetical protein
MKTNILGRSFGFLAVCLATVAMAGCSDRSEPDESNVASSVMRPDTVLYVPQEGDIVIPMAYRGLSGTKDDITYGWSMGMGQDDESSEFLTQVRQKKPGILPVYNSRFKHAEWSGLDVTDGLPTLLYLDLNADGTLDHNESLSPLESDSEKTTFLTPDFYACSPDGIHRLCRALLIVSTYDPDQPPSCMWQPASLLAGEVTLQGKAQKLLLFSADLNGHFNGFGRGGIALLNAIEDHKGYVTRETLSRVIKQNDTFYTVFIQPGDQDFSGAQVVLRAYHGDLGRMAVTLPAQTKGKSRLRALKIVGHDDPGVVINIKGDRAELPVRTYTLQSGTLMYGQDDTEDWQAEIECSQAIVVKANETTAVILNKPQLGIHAIDQKRRYDTKAKPGSRFKKGTTVYLTRNLAGKAGEVYGQIYRIDQGTRYDYVLPHLVIMNDAGTPLVSTDLEYG